MIQGATRRRASAYRIPVETTTRPASQTQAGTPRARATARLRTSILAAASTAKPDLVQPLGQLPGLAQARLGGGTGDLAQDRLVHRLTAGRFFERGDIGLGDPIEQVLALGQDPRGLPHRAPGLLVGKK